MEDALLGVQVSVLYLILHVQESVWISARLLVLLKKGVRPACLNVLIVLQDAQGIVEISVRLVQQVVIQNALMDVIILVKPGQMQTVVLVLILV